MMSHYGMEAKTGKMIQNPNFSKTMTFFSVVGGAVGIYEMFNVDSAEAAAAEQQLRAALTRLQSHNYTDLGDQRREVAWAVKKYVDVLTAGNIENYHVHGLLVGCHENPGRRELTTIDVAA